MRRLLLLLLPLLLGAGDPPTDPRRSPALARWEALLASGCDLDAQPLRLALEARFLRKVPYARQGWVFQAAELRAFFAADGGWYHENQPRDLLLGGVVSECLAKLKEREDALRASCPWPEELERRLLADHDLLTKGRGAQPLPDLGAGLCPPYLGPTGAHQPFSEEGGTWRALLYDCAEEPPGPGLDRCSSASIACPEGGACRLDFAD